MTENNVSGVLIVNKPAGITSHDVVRRIRKLYNTKKVGHTGTLDPIAEGVLCVLVGRAAKAAEYLVSDDKEYIAGLKLGITTDTEDITGNIIQKFEGKLPDFNDLQSVLGSFLGEIKQVPPMYSAIKVQGKKLYEYARENIEVERQPRKITIYDIKADIIDEKNGEYSLTVRCSKGTYIRTLCADIGKNLGCGGVMSSLLRTKSGTFSLKDAITLDELEKMSETEKINMLKPTESLFSNLPKVVLSDFFAFLCRTGNEIYQHKIKTNFDTFTKVALYDKDGFFALGEVREFEGGSAIKPIKQFKID